MAICVAGFKVPILNGIVVGGDTYNTGSFQNLNNARLIIGSAYGGDSPLAGYVSRSFIINQSNLALPDMAKLYDLGMGAS